MTFNYFKTISDNLKAVEKLRATMVTLTETLSAIEDTLNDAKEGM